MAALWLLAAFSAAGAAASEPTPLVLRASGPAAVTGLSAGAFAAVQYHVAFSSELVGAGIIAGGPFYCAQNSEAVALTSCMQFPAGIDVSGCLLAAQVCAESGVCDGLSFMRAHRVWLFSGSMDSVVDPGVMKKLVEFYQAIVVGGSINTTFAVPAEHSWPTNGFGNACGTLGSPYINDCHFNASYAMLQHIFGGSLQPGVPASSTNIFTLDQSKFAPSGDSAAISMGPKAYVYAPQACQASSASAACRLVIVLHGCQQTLGDIGTAFIEHIGVNEVAQANNMVVLYPQAIRSSLFPLNPEGCFDWWGYTGASYSNRQGPQLAAINGMVKALAKGVAVTPLHA